MLIRTALLAAVAAAAFMTSAACSTDNSAAVGGPSASTPAKAPGTAVLAAGRRPG